MGRLALVLTDTGIFRALYPLECRQERRGGCRIGNGTFGKELNEQEGLLDLLVTMTMTMMMMMQTWRGT